MSDNKSKKRGLFGWFGKKDGTESSDTEAAEEASETQPEELEEKLEKAEDAIEHAIEDDLEQQLDTPEPELTEKVTSADNLAERPNQAELPLGSDINDEPQSEPEAEAEAENDASLHDTTSGQSSEESTPNKNTDQLENQPTEATVEPTPTHSLGETQERPSKKGFFARLKDGLSKTRNQFTSGIADLVLGSKQIDDDLLEEIETHLLMADVGVEATRRIIDDLTDKAERKELKNPEALMDRLRLLLSEILEPCSAPLELTHKPHVILMVGVNGVGKTTTIGKLAKKFQQEDQSVMLAAGDTFRAAAVEQLQVWGERNNIHVTAQHTGADSASVIFDALQSAQRRQVDVLIADTAGRLHTKSNLMEELSKVKRVMQKLDPSAPHEIMLVVDAGTGQNALNQAEHFHKSINLTGVTITKLDGTAKGGIIFALADKLQIPIRFIGVGEGIDDLRQFNANDFIEALFSKE